MSKCSKPRKTQFTKTTKLNESINVTYSSLYVITLKIRFYKP